MERSQKEHDPISRVKCVVDTCDFWDSHNHCLASSIEVQAPGATDTQDTDCATFRPKHQEVERPMKTPTFKVGVFVYAKTCNMKNFKYNDSSYCQR